jgi:two-component system, OmpR family, sensor kinase
MWLFWVSMFRTRILIAFLTLGFAAIIQGGVAWWAIHVATDNVLRGRVASDVLTSFLELYADQRHLRIWASEALIDTHTNPRQRHILQKRISITLKNLRHLTQKAAINDPYSHLSTEYEARQRTLNILEKSFYRLDKQLDAIQPLPSTTNAQQVNHIIQQIFDLAEGLDLHTLIIENISRERTALARERAAVDASLELVKTLALGTTLTSALAAVLLAIYFSQALRRPFAALSAGAQALQQGVLEYRMPEDREDEFSRFGHSVNTMANELQQHRLKEKQARQRLEELVQMRTNELQDALHTLQQLDLRRRQLFADLSHELRTPTTAIRGEAEITLRGRDKPIEEYKWALQRIVTIAQQLGMVIEDVLTMARSDIDMLVFDRQLLNIDEPLQAAIEQLGSAINAQQVTLNVDIINTQIMGDPQRLRQIFTLILDNAIGYSHHQGHIQLVGHLVQHPEYGHTWQLMIRDQGIGIASDELQRVFERHFRSNLARQHRPDGSGLGLAIAAALVHAHNGYIEIQSQMDQGTTVLLWFPIYEQDCTQG